MKLALLALLATGCLIVAARSEDEYDYEEEGAAPAPVTPSTSAKPTSGRLGGLLSSRGRVTVGRKGPATTQATTAKPVEQPAEAEEEVDEELEENQEQEDVPTTTTESSKIVRSGVRPFRSNQDLLAALKRRRAQVPSHRETSSAGQPAESTTPKSKASTSSRAKSTGTTESKSSVRGRFGGTRGKPVQEEVEETQREEVQVKAKPYRRG
ncbi:uncharacterized protein LOC117220954 isoform X2 [Megalopta genalis]|uniref:uncharacterized protein LOC117220954 isoform X2 n=1 Tax=Megalopta genalis TaxID=115081 RepID=UPI0014435BE9|nr:uncharacterized protein LOC117220954 isoform X2 [Megalopta genalis]